MQLGRPGRVAPPGALATAPLVASLTPLDRYELDFHQRHRNACTGCVRVKSAWKHTAARVRVTPVSYWAGVAGGGRGLASVRGSFIFPGRAARTCRLWKLFRL